MSLLTKSPSIPRASASPKVDDGLRSDLQTGFSTARSPRPRPARQNQRLETARLAALRQARRQGMDDNDAEDIASRFVLDLLAQEEKGTVHSQDEAYLHFAAGRFARREAAGESKRARREICFSSGDRPGGDAPTLEVATPDLTWAEVSNTEFRADLSDALAALTPDQRHAFLWRHRDDEPVPVIAARLNRTEGATRQLLYTARHALRKPLANWGEKLFLFLLFFALTKPLATAPYHHSNAAVPTHPASHPAHRHLATLPRHKPRRPRGIDGSKNDFWHC